MIPSFLVKLTAPYYIHVVPYEIRILGFVALSTCGMLLVALSPGGSIPIKMLGIVLASISSGGGELSFLGLTHFYGPLSLAAWGSGTGGAGLIGAGAYVILTTTLGFSVRTSLLAFSFLPIIMLLTFFALLPRKDSLKLKDHVYAPAAQNDDTDSESLLNDALNDHRRPPSPNISHGPKNASDPWQNFKVNLYRVRGLFFP